MVPVTFFRKAGLQPETITPAARTDNECACCQICNYHYGYESENCEPPFLDMYVCDVCHRTYHWKCMIELGCHTDEQRKEIDTANTWACPACAGLSDAQKIDRERLAKEELWRVTWKPSWEPEELKETWPKFRQCLCKFDAN
eukprot:1150238-Pelagomonas_calceolata.AAC.1